MLGRLDDKDALKQGYSRLLNYFSDPVSELPLTYRGELQVIHGDSIFDVGAQRDCFGFNLIPQHVLDTLTSLLHRYKKPTLPVFRVLFCKPYDELLHVSEEGKLECCRNARKAQCHRPKRPSVTKRITLTYVE
jgi:hypothetical protein